MPLVITVACTRCGREFTAKKSWQHFCCTGCRVAYQREAAVLARGPGSRVGRVCPCVALGCSNEFVALRVRRAEVRFQHA
jgi:hypothetical protein